MARARPRFAIQKAIAQRLHRYALLRLLSQTMSLAILVLVPWTGLAAVDLWGGEHRLLFRPAPIKHALGGVIIGIGAMYVVTFLSNVVAGRLFCGWGCPVGQISRFGDAVDQPGLKPAQRLLRQVQGAAFSGLFILAMMAWWVDLRVLWMGDGTALALVWGTLAVSVAAAYGHGRWWRWGFCKSLCPIGQYYSFVAPASYFGIHFRNQQQACIDCDACDKVCPVDLTPRDLGAPVSDRVGLAIADAPGHNHCLECGDCIRACEFMVSRKHDLPAPLRLGWFAGPQRIAGNEPSESADKEVRDASPAPAIKGKGGPPCPTHASTSSG